MAFERTIEALGTIGRIGLFERALARLMPYVYKRRGEKR